MRLAIVPGGNLEPLADRPVALVLAEEAVEEIRARLAELRQRLPHGQREVELGERLVRPMSMSSVGSTRARSRRRSMQRLRVSWASHGLTAASSRSRSSRSYVRAKTSWKTSSASCSERRKP